jgi:hypothetical protein
MLLVVVKTATLSLDAASQAWLWICRPDVGQKNSSFFGSWVATFVSNKFGIKRAAVA